MEAFSYQLDSSFLMASSYNPNTPIDMPFQLPQQVQEPTLPSSSYIPYYYPSETNPQTSATDSKNYESSSSLYSGSEIPACKGPVDGSSKAAETHGGDEASKSPPTSSQKKRKSPGQPKDTKQSKNMKQGSPCDDLKANKDKSEESYIHVRVRRGQATDSHSLAERVRREKISERMKMLQGLVPGCEKVTGKALVLDEIINYVQSLQNQIEFLSMKLVSLNPIMYTLDEEYDGCKNQPEADGGFCDIKSQMRDNTPETMPTVMQASCHIQPSSFGPMMDCSPLLQTQGPPITFSHEVCHFSEASSSQGQQTISLLNQAAGFNNMYSLQ